MHDEWPYKAEPNLWDTQEWPHQTAARTAVGQRVPESPRSHQKLDETGGDSPLEPADFRLLAS